MLRVCALVPSCNKQLPELIMTELDVSSSHHIKLEVFIE